MPNERLEKTKKNLIAWRENHDEDALIELMNSNEAFIGFFVSKYMHYGISYDDLFSIGREAFFRAINLFDYKNNAIDCFTTYAGNAITRDIVRELNKEFVNNKNVSLNTPIGKGKDGDDITYEDILGTDIDALVDEVIAKHKGESIQKYFVNLTPMEKKVIILRFAFEKENMMPIPEIAKELKVSKEIVRRYEKRALIKLRKFDDLKELMD